MTRPTPPATDHHGRRPLLPVDSPGCAISTPRGHDAGESRRTRFDPGDAHAVTRPTPPTTDRDPRPPLLVRHVGRVSGTPRARGGVPLTAGGRLRTLSDTGDLQP